MTKKSESSQKKSSQQPTIITKRRCSGEWTEARFRSFVISLLRSGSIKWKPISIAKRKARVGRGLYKCAICGSIVKSSHIEIDHINPIIPYSGFVSYDSFVNGLFCEEDNLQAICSDCHKLKTEKERELRKQFKNK